MISRRTALRLGNVFADRFQDFSPGGSLNDWIDRHALHDFLFEGELSPWICKAMSSHLDQRVLKEFIMHLETGESIPAQEGRSPSKRREYGRAQLQLLIELAVRKASEEQINRADGYAALVASLELDGYQIRDGRLLPAESEANEVVEEKGELAHHYQRLGLPNLAIVKHHLELSEKHYIDGIWDDCIGNSRDYYEQVLHDVAETWSKRTGALPFPPKGKSQPVKIREYLRDCGLLGEDEFQAFSKLYGLLSATGGHPGMAQKDQARIFRRLALTMVQFLLLRYESKVAAP
jgi:hypothetical protein